MKNIILLELIIINFALAQQPNNTNRIVNKCSDTLRVEGYFVYMYKRYPSLKQKIEIIKDSKNKKTYKITQFTKTGDSLRNNIITRLVRIEEYIIKTDINLKEIPITKEILKKANEISIHNEYIGWKLGYIFIPKDSVTQLNTLSNRLSQFFTKKIKDVFIPCHRTSHFIERYCLFEQMSNYKCDFPQLKSNATYILNNEDSDMFKIYYLDAYWLKMKIPNQPIDQGNTESEVAICCMNPLIKEFDLYYFLKDVKWESIDNIDDSNLKIWNPPLE